MGSSQEIIKQLNSARDIVLRDAAIYPQVVPGVLPVIGSSASVELRRWGADFLAETFASPVINAEQKQKMCIGVLDTLTSYLSRKEEVGEEEDGPVVKSAVQCATSIYPLVFGYTISNSTDGETWSKMASIKSGILRNMDSASAGVRICCIKFVARVVQVQTPGPMGDPRRSDHPEISLALVPKDHPIIPPSRLEAEASGLLDRLLGVLQDNTENALIATATLNSLSSLVHRGANISTKILNTVLGLNPLKFSSANKQMVGKDKIVVKSMTRITMTFLLNTLKHDPNHTQKDRIQHQVQRLKEGLEAMFSHENSRKRPSPDEPIDGLDNHKRMRIGEDVEAGTTPLQQSPLWPPPLPPGPVSLAQLFTVGSDARVAGFHVEAIPLHITASLVPPLLHSIPQQRLDEALNVVRARLLELGRRGTSSGLPEEDEGDYDPSAMDFGAGDPEQVANYVDHDMLGPQVQQEMVISLPPPPPLSEVEMSQYSEAARERLFGALRRMDEKKAAKNTIRTEREKGFNRIASAGQERDGWITLLARLATRPAFRSLNDEKDIKDENEEWSVVKKGVGRALPNRIREAFHRYIMDDWRRRIDVAIAWLNEEWYADRMATKDMNDASDEERLPNYTHLTLSLLDGLVLYLDTKDGRYLMRLLSEIPYIPAASFERLKKIALDPERVQLSTQTLLYLIMLKPPVRELAIECAVEMWRENADAKTAAANILKKWRPDVLQEAQDNAVKEES